MDELSYICITDPERGIQECKLFLKQNLKPALKAMVITSLGMIPDETLQRQVYSLLINHIADDALAVPVIQSLGKIRDARATFGLMDYFKKTNQSELRRSILEYFAEAQDPRAASFLRNVLPALQGGIEELAQYALRECEGNTLFVYGFCGSDELYAHALERRYEPIGVTNRELTERAQEIEGNTSGRMLLPQTYIIDAQECKLYVGGQQNEHVVVARGHKVAAAGEITFKRAGDQWSVDTINNRSYGYYPDPCSFYWVKKAFEKTDVACDKQTFDEIYPREGFDDSDLLDLFAFNK